AGVLPKTYNLFTSTLLKELLKKVSEIPASVDYDAFGRIYEYFLGEFARTEGQKGGEFYTPSCIVRLLTEVIEPYHGRILDPACGSGGMFVQSARFVSEHKKNPAAELSIHGVEKTDETGRLCRLNLAVHGLEGDIRHGGNVNSYYDDPHAATGQFDFVLANPPFNVNAVDKERLKDTVGPGRRFPFGLPRTDNANYLWIQLFYSALNSKGRSGFVMANSASDARSSEQELRQKQIEAKAVDVMVAVGPNMFYTVTLPCTLWFLDRGKTKTPRADTVLFIDARHIYRQIDRAHREWTPAQIGGWDDENLTAPELAKALEGVGVAGIFVHGRTREQGFSGTINLAGIRAVVQAVKTIPVVGNGDVTTPQAAKKMFEDTGCAGVSIGRGAFYNPWIFQHTLHYLKTGELLPEPRFEERVRVMCRHLDLMVEIFGEEHGCRMFRKVAPWYARRFGPANEFNKRVVRISSKPEFHEVLENYRRWRQQFADDEGRLMPRFQPPPLVASFMQEPEVARREHIPVPKGPVEVW
ncbi:MAG: type restriction enzyme protein, partial [Verrucomicrobiota bacterium]